MSSICVHSAIFRLFFLSRIMHIVTCEYRGFTGMSFLLNCLVVMRRPGNTQGTVGLLRCIEAAKAMEASLSGHPSPRTPV